MVLTMVVIRVQRIGSNGRRTNRKVEMIGGKWRERYIKRGRLIRHLFLLKKFNKKETLI